MMMTNLHPHICHENDTPNWCTYLVVEYVTMATSYGNSSITNVLHTRKNDYYNEM